MKFWFGNPETFSTKSLRENQRKKVIEIVDYEDLNIYLKRPLQKGTQYQRYFKHSSCTPFYMGKSDTAFTVRQMAKMVYKNKPHTKALALGEFANKSLERTCEEIHSFLFDHVQYELDGEDQLLKSPQCTWATRTQGTDCKSYSIFVSTILCNLGIKHHLRRVKQINPDFARTKKGIDPGLWSHVYVVIPKNQQTMKADNEHDYFIIDATVEGNKEVSFSKKHDTPMTKVSLRHYGLQSPLIRGLSGCTCTEIVQPVKTTIPIVEQLDPIITQLIEPVFAQPIDPLIVEPITTTTRSGSGSVATRRTISTTSTRSNVQTQRGSQHLEGREALQSPWLLHGLGLYGLSESNKSTSQIAGDYTGFALSLFQAGKQGGAYNEASITQGTKQQRLDAIGQTGFTSSIIKASGAGAAAFTFGISALATLIPSQWYEKVLGQLFSGGFSCIGSSWTPKKALQVAEIENEFLRNEAMGVIQKFQTATVVEIEQAINGFVEYFYSIRSVERDWEKTTAKKCTKKGLVLMIKTLDEGFKEYMAMLTQAINTAGHTLAKTGKTKTVKYPAEAHTGRHALTQKVPQYEIIINPAVLGQIQAEEAAKGNNLPIEGPTTTKFKTSSVVGMAALAALAYIAV